MRRGSPLPARRQSPAPVREWPRWELEPEPRELQRALRPTYGVQENFEVSRAARNGVKRNMLSFCYRVALSPLPPLADRRLAGPAAVRKRCRERRSAGCVRVGG